MVGYAGGMKRQRESQRSGSINAQRLRMVEQFRRSGLTRQAFCQREGVPKSTLDWWLRKVADIPDKPAAVVFQEVSTDLTRTAVTAVWAMEVVSPEGWTIRSREALSGRDMADRKSVV